MAADKPLYVTVNRTTFLPPERTVEALKEAILPEGSEAPETVPGEPGKSAYQIAVDAGYTGTQTQWLESLRGTPGLGFAWRGGWDWQAQYVVNDVVNYGGAAWAATAPNTNMPCPSHPEAWSLFADRGQPGASGSDIVVTTGTAVPTSDTPGIFYIRTAS
jgi:hypothetical protein